MSDAGGRGPHDGVLQDAPVSLKGGQAGRDPRTREHHPPSLEPPLALLPKRIHGRDDIKPRLVSALGSPDRRIRVLHGIAGGGKSSLALWLAGEANNQGRNVYWIRNGNVAQSMYAVAAHRGVDLDQRNPSPDEVWESLERVTEPWLLVFDDVDDVDQPGLRSSSGTRFDGTGWIRASRAGLVVVTSRHGDPRTWGDDAVLCRVDCLDDGQGAAVLCELAPDAGPEEDARRLATRLGGLPLALRLAGHYLANRPLRHRTFAAYREAVQSNLELLDAGEPTPATLSDEESARRSIRLTWELSLTLLEDRDLRPARPLLELLACYGAPHPISVDLLVAEQLRGTPVDCGRELTETYLFDHVLTSLIASALVDRIDLDDGGGDPISQLALHPLLAEVIATTRDESPRGDEIWTAAIRLLDNASPRSADPARWERWRTMPAVYEAVLKGLPARLTEPLADAVGHGSICAGYLVRTGALPAAHQMSTLALDRAAELEPRHPVRFAARLAAAVVNQAQGSSVVRDELRALLNDAREALPPDEVFLIVVRQQLAAAVASTDQLDEAEEIYRELLADHERGIGVDREIATRFGFGQLMSTRGQFEVAEREITAVLAAERELFADDPDHPELLNTRIVLADIWAGQGRLVAARDELRAVLRAQERVHGPESPLTLAVRMELVAVLNLLRDEGGAHDQLSQLLRIQRDALNPEHPLALLGLAALINDRTLHSVADADPRTTELRLNEVSAAMAGTMGEDNPVVLAIRLSAAIQRSRYDTDGAEVAVRDLLDRQSAMLGPDHVATLNTRLIYAQLLVEADQDNPRAEAELRDLLAAQLRTIGSDHPQTAVVRYALANISFRNGGLEESVRLLRESLDTSLRLHGPDHKDARATRTTLAQVLSELERYEESERELLPLVESLDRTEPDSNDALAAQVMLALVRWQEGRAAEAERDLRAVLGTLDRLPEGHEYDILVVRWILGSVLRDRGEYDEAARLLLSVLDGLGEQDGNLTEVWADLGEVLHEAGRLTEAERYLQLAQADLSGQDGPLADRVRSALSAVSAELQAQAKPAGGTATPAEPEEAPPADAPGLESADSWRGYLAGTQPRPGPSPAATESDDPDVPRVRISERDMTPPDASPQPAPSARPTQARQGEPDPFDVADALRAQGRLAEAERVLIPLLSTKDVWLAVDAHLVGIHRERCTTQREDARLTAVLAQYLTQPGLTDPERAGVRRQYALALDDQGFPAAAHAQMCAALALHRRAAPRAEPAQRLRYLVDATVARPDDGGDELPEQIDRVYRAVVTEVGAEHELALRMRRGSAELSLRRGALTGAVAELDETLAARQHHSSLPDREKTLLRHALAVAFHRIGDLAVAEKHARQAVEECATLLGAEHPHALSARATLAAIRADLGVASGLPELRSVLNAQLRRRGAHHPDVATTRHHLGMLAKETSDQATAQRELTTALQVRTHRLGPQHPTTHTTHESLTNL
ncbi:tetratricopeptide repeat protein [Saccharopolyspora phatthalungensis]|uniref:Tetratricopeptide (TPR) repeat protein n=1 Tax=Saccharopolyspora phatthalungensis TaxID=664693 RepID=A0A840Q836_9PSEU|nr:tetratricopeptide repeat protein [Saccharopolyspora phatthalungensis]MBB5156097.1 tetratricopeptide (TPR) repeat protein [Saccharopolyspora phatthalungensis]